MKRAIAIGVLTILAIAAFIYSAQAPYRTVDALEHALLTGDQDQLNETVDFPKLRQNLKDQLNAIIAADMSTSEDASGLDLLSAGWATTMIDKLIDAFVTPEAIVNMMQGKAPGETGGDQQQPESLFEDAEFGYDSTSTFIVTMTEDDQVTRLVLERYGLNWKLTNILLSNESISSSVQDSGPVR